MMYDDQTNNIIGRKRLLLHVSFSAIVVIFLALSGCQSDAIQKNTQPNIVLIMADDMGYSDLGCYGSEIETPNLDALAKNGIRFNRFYNNTRCCPTRATLLSGLYPHNAGVGKMILPAGKEGPEGPYQGYLTHNAVTIAEALKPAGYHSYLSGKWHVGEAAENWPLTRGFERYFGLISGASSYFELLKNPERQRVMALDNQSWEPPAEGFYMTDAITDRAIEWIDTHNKQYSAPFFLYVAYTAPHWPLHAMSEDIAKYQGKYDVGWDSLRVQRYSNLKSLGLINENTLLSQRPEEIPAWADVEDKAEWARRMEVYAAMLDRMDQGIGRIIETLKEQGDFDNTLIIFLSDNGASDENVEKRGLNDPSIPIGLKGSYAAYRAPWANLSNTPYRYFKKSIHEGGIASPLIAHWPSRIKAKNAIVDQLGSVADFHPPFLEIAGVDYPTTFNEYTIKPTDGISLLSALETQKPILRQPLFWEHGGNRAIRDKDWKLVAHSWGDWELYNLKEDGSETKDLIRQYPEIADSLLQLYSVWAEKVGVRAHN